MRSLFQLDAAISCRTVPILIVIFACFVHDARGDLVINFSPNGSDTNLDIVGSLDLTGMSGGGGAGTSSPSAQLFGGFSRILTQTSSPQFVMPDGSLSLFGTAPGTSASINETGFGGAGFFDGNPFDIVLVPNGYASGQSLNLKHTFTDLTFADFGLTVGDAWGATFPIFDAGGSTTGMTQSIRFQAAAAAIPEPGSFQFLGLVGLMMLGAKKLRSTSWLI